MTVAHHNNLTSVTSCGDEAAATLGIEKCLCLAATPTFAIMALMTGISGGGLMDTLCSGGHGSPLTGMVLMYMLMSAFHSVPWLELTARRRKRRPGESSHLSLLSTSVKRRIPVSAKARGLTSAATKDIANSN